ncbi:MAG TPA: HD domain-containing phosphohydrolase [bacterium]|nr:HD domain-containing phosphohydrolase [bacterium]
MSDKKKKIKNNTNIQSSNTILEYRDKFKYLRQNMDEVEYELEELQMLSSKLLDVGVAISSEIDLYSLLTRIIDEAKGLLKAEKGTLYLVDPEYNELYFHVTDADMLKEIRIKIDRTSIAGYVSLACEPLNIEDVYRIDEKKPYSFNRNIDKKTGYRTKSMLTVPMLNHNSEVTGAVQLINKNKNGRVVPFSERDERVLMSLASQAAVSIENAQLYKEVADLLNALVRYSASAIDERDPATAGHSRRVAMYAIATARAMDCFTDDELMELEYSAWLHDIGKIGIREQILVKKYKLYPGELERIAERFETIKMQKMLAAEKTRNKLVKKNAARSEFEELELELKKDLESIENDFRFIEKINKPGFMPQEDSMRLDEISNKTYTNSKGGRKKYLTAYEVKQLHVQKGNLTDKERLDMNTHVDSTFKILSQIPFPKRMKRVPYFASCHHEKLDGSGYPNNLSGKEIPLQGRILALVDIYDALTAQDRPYKPAIPVDKALSILDEEVRLGHLDKKVYDVFLSNKIYAIKDTVKDSNRIILKARM